MRLLALTDPTLDPARGALRRGWTPTPTSMGAAAGVAGAAGVGSVAHDRPREETLETEITGTVTAAAGIAATAGEATAAITTSMAGPGPGPEGDLRAGVWGEGTTTTAAASIETATGTAFATEDIPTTAAGAAARGGVELTRVRAGAAIEATAIAPTEEDLQGEVWAEGTTTAAAASIETATETDSAKGGIPTTAAMAEARGGGGGKGVTAGAAIEATAIAPTEEEEEAAAAAATQAGVTIITTTVTTITTTTTEEAEAAVAILGEGAEGSIATTTVHGCCRSTMSARPLLMARPLRLPPAAAAGPGARGLALHPRFLQGLLPLGPNSPRAPALALDPVRRVRVSRVRCHPGHAPSAAPPARSLTTPSSRARGSPASGVRRMRTWITLRRQCLATRAAGA
jgi:hypothetical protein